MKERLLSAIALLEGLLASNQIPVGGQAEIQFKQAIQEIQGAIDAPAPEPVTIVQTEVATGVMADQIAVKMTDVLIGMKDVMTGFGQRLQGIETATIGLLDPIKASNDKLDGMEDVLAAFVASHQEATPA